MIDWNLEVEADKIKNGGRFGAKRVREDVFCNNREVFGRWAVPTESEFGKWAR